MSETSILQNIADLVGLLGALILVSHVLQGERIIARLDKIIALLERVK